VDALREDRRVITYVEACGATADRRR